MHERRAATGVATNSPARIGSYSILGVIGKGGMGTVYLAEDPRLKRRIAIKMLPESQPLSAESLARFRREAQILARLSHPNIAAIYALEEENGAHFITMEFVTGHTLSQHIGRQAIDPERSYRICRQIAAALDAAHRQGVIHRDLKPSNVMVTPHEQVKVLDFGLAKVVKSPPGHSDSTVTISQGNPGNVVGTCGYMSPEQLRGLEVDARCDVWAFGCCLYECLSGRMAFPGRTTAELVAATLERDPDLGALGQLPQPIVDLLSRSFEKDPDRRLPSLSSAIELIDRVCAVR
jgi:serine/threonine protein kinase